jgi:hypothetical protein
MLVYETEGHDEPHRGRRHNGDQHFELDETLFPLIISGVKDRDYITPAAALCALVFPVIFTFLWWHGACAGSALGNAFK